MSNALKGLAMGLLLLSHKCGSGLSLFQGKSMCALHQSNNVHFAVGQYYEFVNTSGSVLHKDSLLFHGMALRSSIRHLVIQKLERYKLLCLCIAPNLLSYWAEIFVSLEVISSIRFEGDVLCLTLMSVSARNLEL